MGRLVLSRNKNQSVYIDVPPSTEWTRIEVSNVDTRNHRARLMFEAPRLCRIVRAEIDDREDPRPPTGCGDCCREECPECNPDPAGPDPRNR